MSFLTDMAERDLSNISVLTARWHKIIDADIEQNYAGRGYDPAAVKAGFDAYRAGGGKFFANATSVIIYRDAGARTVEFHTTNAGTARDLTASVTDFLGEMSAEFERAVTFYDNEKINGLLKFVPHESMAERIDDGLDRTFRATFILARVT